MPASGTRATSSSPLGRLLALSTALLAACGGGSSTPTAPAIRNLLVTPDAVYVSATPVRFMAQFEFTDPDGDLASARLVVTDPSGAVTATQVTQIEQANGVTAAHLAGSATAALAAPGTFTAHLSLTDRAGLVSNELTADVTVRLFPWTTGATNPQPVHDPAVVALGDRVYALGGERTDLFSQGPATDRATAYDPVLDAWAPLPAMPTRRVGLTAAANDGRIYAIGGATTPETLPIGTRTDIVEEFDPQLQTWRSRAPMPTARAHAAAAALGGRIVVAGGDLDDGYSFFTPVATVESYDPTTDTWSTLPALPRPRSGARATVSGGKLLVGGAPFETTGVTPEIDVYDPVANEWSVLSLPVPCSTAWVSDGVKLWALADSTLSATDDPATGGWRHLTDSGVSLPRGVGALVGDRIVAVNATTTVRYLSADEIH